MEDLTLFMDIERNPGPLVAENKNRTSGSEIPHGPEDKNEPHKSYSRDELLKLRSTGNVPLGRLLLDRLKSREILKYRGNRAGRKKIKREANQITVMLGRRVERTHNDNIIARDRVLIPIPRSKATTTPIYQFAVPKCLFLNICSLLKTKNGVKASAALEVDLYTADVDLCVISETNLKREIPDSVIAISNYTIYRRDRNWFGNDKRQRGGVAIYVRNNIRVLSVIRSELYECVSLIIELPSGHKMLMCGIYHPPTTNYMESELIAYVSDTIDEFLEANPDGLVICGGDLNRLNIERLSMSTGMKSLVDFPTRGYSVLDNCLTNYDNLFSPCYPINAQIKTDHKGVILPAGMKLKPLRCKYKLRDYREHRKIAFYQRLLDHQWVYGTCVDSVVDSLTSDIHSMMEDCFPFKTVRMSSRDPDWITPLVKVLLKKRNKLQIKNPDSANEISKRIAQLIKENRKALTARRTGSGMWWKNVDKLSN